MVVPSGLERGAVTVGAALVAGGVGAIASMAGLLAPTAIATGLSVALPMLIAGALPLDRSAYLASRSHRDLAVDVVGLVGAGLVVGVGAALLAIELSVGQGVAVGVAAAATMLAGNAVAVLRLRPFLGERGR